MLTRTKPEKLAGITVDFSNAFNEAKRDEILKALFKEPELMPIWRLANWAYETPGKLWIRNEEGLMIQPDDLLSTSGVKQGDPLGSLLFALVVKPIYETALKADPTGSVDAVAFLDDCTLVGPPGQELTHAFEVLKLEAKKMGLEINMSKTKLLWMHNNKNELIREELPITFTQYFRDMGIKQIDEGATIILGAGVGNDIAKLQLQTLASAQQHKILFERIQHKYIPMQISLILLRKCGLPRMNYLCRTTAPNAVRPAAKWFDECVNEVLVRKFDLPDVRARDVNSSTTRAQIQLTLPVKMSGLGLRTTTSLTSQAYLASTSAQALDNNFWRHEKNIITEETNRHLFHTHKQVMEEVKNSIRKEDVEILCPKRDNILHMIKQIAEEEQKERELNPKTHTKNSRLLYMQKLFGKSYNRRKLTELEQLMKESAKKNEEEIMKDNEGKENYVRELVRIKLLQLKTNLSHLWLNVIPKDETLQLPNHDYIIAIKQRLGLQAYKNQHLLECVCHKRKAFSYDPYHALTCRVTAHKGYIIRHNLILNQLATWTRRAYITTVVEPSHLSHSTQQRPDLILEIGGETLLVDVTVTNPLSFNKSQRMIKKLNSKPTQRQLKSKQLKSKPITNANAPNTIPIVEQERKMEEREAKKNEMEEEATQEEMKTVEKNKRNKYHELIADHAASFLTAGVYTTGGVGREFLQLYEAIADEVATKDCYTHMSNYTAQEINEGVRAAVAIAVQAGNARMFRSNRGVVLKYNQRSEMNQTGQSQLSTPCITTPPRNDYRISINVNHNNDEEKKEEREGIRYPNTVSRRSSWKRGRRRGINREGPMSYASRSQRSIQFTNVNPDHDIQVHHHHIDTIHDQSNVNIHQSLPNTNSNSAIDIISIPSSPELIPMLTTRPIVNTNTDTNANTNTTNTDRDTNMNNEQEMKSSNRECLSKDEVCWHTNMYNVNELNGLGYNMFDLSFSLPSASTTSALLDTNTDTAAGLSTH